MANKIPRGGFNPNKVVHKPYLNDGPATAGGTGGGGGGMTVQKESSKSTIDEQTQRGKATLLPTEQEKLIARQKQNAKKKLKSYKIK